MNNPFYINALGHKYIVEYDNYYGYYLVTSDTGYTFKVDKETFDNEYINSKSS